MKDQHCKDYCRLAAGYDSGLYVEVSGKCYCADVANEEAMGEKKIVLPSKPRRREPGASYEKSVKQDIVPYSLPWESE